MIESKIDEVEKLIAHALQLIVGSIAEAHQGEDGDRDIRDILEAVIAMSAALGPLSRARELGVAYQDIVIRDAAKQSPWERDLKGGAK